MNNVLKKIAPRLSGAFNHCNAKRTRLLAVGPQMLCTQNQSNSASAANQKLYELRTYSLKPKHFKYFMELSQEWMHLRLGHSKLIGYWISEIGGINDVVHLWEYDSLTHRAGVRQALAKDDVWIGSYFSKLLPLLQRQENSLLLVVPGTTLNADQTASGCYEIEKFSYGDTGLSDVVPPLVTRQKIDGTLLGSFYSILGDRAVYQFWRHPDIDGVIKSSLDLDRGAHFERLPSTLRCEHSRLLLPTPWSPLK